jgi:hypothetical protein
VELLNGKGRRLVGFVVVRKVEVEAQAEERRHEDEPLNPFLDLGLDLNLNLP